ncbi:MAG: type II toxin-antitoxin system VapC family toxin [Proteobacteria bacterium]|nr:type II toxin-antitoxin system VapC family toxin [Pseudomonadota bacterium]MBU4472376.1 type II toxin-antitoxin system VapC family toxin [Pseudomonadota bacterium]MCG2752072.1 type II toxin-antitoxin system VapC family toxin [Desulfobacteraceae bacterium]
MNLLLDTHVLLWWLDESPSLSVKAREAIANSDNLVVLSAATLWEIRIKQSLDKLKIPPDFYSVVQQQKFDLLPITHKHAYGIGDFPYHHRDPFDRILISQAKIENLTIITHDAIFKKYPVPLLKT